VFPLALERSYRFCILLNEGLDFFDNWWVSISVIQPVSGRKNALIVF
jgi:hypothetical protein